MYFFNYNFKKDNKEEWDRDQIVEDFKYLADKFLLSLYAMENHQRFFKKEEALQCHQILDSLKNRKVEAGVYIKNIENLSCNSDNNNGKQLMYLKNDNTLIKLRGFDGQLNGKNNGEENLVVYLEYKTWGETY